jgi:hypothetical protein
MMMPVWYFMLFLRNSSRGINVDQHSKPRNKCKYSILYLHLFRGFECWSISNQFLGEIWKKFISRKMYQKYLYRRSLSLYIYMNIYVYIYIYRYIYLYIYIYIYIYVCIDIYIPIYIYIHIHTYVYIYVYTYTYMYMNIYMYLYLRSLWQDF